ncbi:MAG: class I SAM-dependent methyltransferase, partial [Candidatus Colwellbacteria bacterium]|nr:class I SAM-dependent methyltransferase [Candidatus Colwellbacteria bacterium]
KWKTYSGIPDSWPIEFGGLSLNIRLSTFKHTGIFPEHKPNWEWVSQLIEKSKENHRDKPVSILNLFGYTGGATLAAAKSGAEAVHIDGSKVAISWAKENAKISGLGEKPIRWILDDAMSFVKKEIKRGRKYDGIIMDPPAYGHGPKGEVWKIERDLPELVNLCNAILSDKPLFLLVNGYASGYSAIAYGNMLGRHFTDKKIEIGELTIKERDGRLLPAGIFSRINFQYPSPNIQ